jgi:thymidine phosphorylase
VGNALEVIEAIETLKGHGPEDFVHFCEKLATKMLSLEASPEMASTAREKISHLLRSGQGLEKFRQVIEAQGGDPGVVDDYSKLPRASHQQDVISPVSGYVVSLNARIIGKASMALGAGRERVDSLIDPGVGVLLHRKIGDFASKGEPLCTVHYNRKSKFQDVRELVADAFQIGSARIEPPSLIKGYVG